MSLVSIVPSELSHVNELAKNLREKDRIEAEALGLTAYKALHYSFKHGLLRKTAFVDNEIAAMWGVGGTPMSILGQPYLITSPVCETVSPLLFARIYKNEVRIMKSLFPVLENYVHADYTQAVKMLRLAGFTIGPEILIDDNRFYKFTLH